MIGERKTWLLMWTGISLIAVGSVLGFAGLWWFHGERFEPVMSGWWFIVMVTVFVLGFTIMLTGLVIEWRQGVLEERLFTEKHYPKTTQKE